MDGDGKFVGKKEDTEKAKKDINTKVIKASGRQQLAELCQYSCYYAR